MTGPRIKVGKMVIGGEVVADNTPQPPPAEEPVKKPAITLGVKRVTATREQLKEIKAKTEIEGRGMTEEQLAALEQQRAERRKRLPRPQSEYYKDLTS